MNKAEEIERIIREAEAVRLSPAKLCSRAGIAASTWWRNRKNPESMTLDTLEKLEAAIKAKRAELAAA